MIYSLETVRESVYDPNAANIFVLVSIFAADKLITPGFLLTHVIGILCYCVCILSDIWWHGITAATTVLRIKIVIFSITKQDLKGMECCGCIIWLFHGRLSTETWQSLRCSDCRCRLCTWDGGDWNTDREFGNGVNSLFPCKCQTHCKTKSELRGNGK